MRFLPSALLLASLAVSGVAAEEQDAGEAVTPEGKETLPRIDELVPNVSAERPDVEEVLRTPEQRYPNAGEILRAMREIPPLERPHEERPVQTADAGAESASAGD